MAKTEKRHRDRTIGSSSYFLDCFGFSRKIYSEKSMKDDGGEKKMKKKKFRSLWSKFRLKHGEIKPSPIEVNEKKTFSSDKQEVVPVIRRLTDRTNIPVDDKSMNHEPKETKQELREKNTDGSKLMEPLLVSSKEDTCLKRVYTSAEPEMKPSRGRNKSFDPVIGISIIILTLMIMLIWGRLCAILCTSAWCYFLPRLREAAALAKRKRSGSGSAFVPDLKKSQSSSSSCKKKVVLDGRQNRGSLF